MTDPAGRFFCSSCGCAGGSAKKGAARPTPLCNRVRPGAYCASAADSAASSLTASFFALWFFFFLSFFFADFLCDLSFYFLTVSVVFADFAAASFAASCACTRGIAANAKAIARTSVQIFFMRNS